MTEKKTTLENKKKDKWNELKVKDYSMKTTQLKKKKSKDGAGFRLFHLKCWIFAIGLLVFVSAIGLFHPEINTGEAMVMFFLSAPIFVKMMKHHKYLKQHFNSPEYKQKREEERQIKAEKDAERYKKDQETTTGKNEYKSQAAEKENTGSGCCLIALVLLIFYVPIKIIAELTRKYH